MVMVLEDLRGSGNAGTIFRTGEGAGVSRCFSYENLRRHYKSKRSSAQQWDLFAECLSYMWRMWYH